MSNNKNVQLYLDFLNSKHQELLNVINRMILLFIESDINQKENIYRIFEKIVKELLSAIPADSRPSWLLSLINIVNNYSGIFKQSEVRYKIIDKLIIVLEEIKEHTWDLEVENHFRFNFDNIYKECKQETKLEELFDQIIELLQKIIDSGEVDSIKTLTTLEKLLASIKNHKTASYLAQKGMEGLLFRFIKNYAVIQLSELPIVGSLIKSLEKTIKESKVEMDQIDISMKEKMDSAFEVEFKLLGNNNNKNLNS